MTLRKDKPYFRDMLQTVDEQGKRRWLYPKRPSGKLYSYRWVVAIILLLFFVAGPFIMYKGEPLILLNVLERRFILFGQVFWPQDFHLLVLSIIALLVFIILFTVVFGRVFCGWTCPQTIFMEFVFRQIEFLIEGGSHSQRALNQQVWNFEKISKKVLKHTLFIVVALLVIHLLAAYIMGVGHLGGLIVRGPLANPGLFIVLTLFSAVFYFVFAFFREQVCILVCPYGRLQSVLLDENSIVVSYDYKRGEPRSPLKLYENRVASDAGHCIDCQNCVAVCPTGIDIRNGTQLECINCTACIDACNQVMERINLPRGLVRFDSEKGISTGNKNIFNPRAIAYMSVLVVLLTATIWMFASRADVEATILRVPGSLYQEYGPDSYANIYKIQLVNKTRQSMPIDMKVTSHEADIVFIGYPITAIKGEVTEATFMVVFPKSQLTSGNTPIQFGLFSGDKLLTRYKTNFIGPGG